MKSKLISIFVILISLLCIQSFVYAADDDSSSNVTWTDFSKAQYKIESDNRSCYLSVSNVTKNSESTYRYFITSTNTKPSTNLENIFDDINKTTTLSTVSELNSITSYVELNQDLYLWIIERQYDKEWKYNYVVEGKKLERPKYPTYSDVFFATYISHDETSINFNVPWGDHSRKINLKIGKIDDTTILNKIKNKEDDAFQKLLEYSKKSNAIYNKQLISTDTGTYYDDGYHASSNNGTILDLSNLIQDGSFYFMYAQLDDENGKYYPVEGITYAKAKISEDDWSLVFLSSLDSWNIPENPTTTTKPSTTTPTASSKKDTTVAKTSIPFAGNKVFILIIVVTTLVILAIVGKVQYNKYKDIK